ncbi:enoyl-CoA hydratase-related protein [Caldibacillus lycopersici]|uniref:Enoyl-CoA hydratase-related protein n=1 Tax=Perspicuibacillus lycopersici TaxID=1325689 RepID=A0AAE3LMI8_9BACI|nr:enoyl-CoA hydratase-related protein [Perspicuibacillus lycopersici]MCU9612792.1 enoyl-CoA hydratase-related protein [Perspicuibacillus lycopersici]
METVYVEKQNGIAIITLNRPTALNAVNRKMLLELDKTVKKIHEDSETRIVLFTGAGGKAFSSGADLKERGMMTDAEVHSTVNKIRTVFQKIAELPQPTIAAVNGYAFGGGFELMLACDFRIAQKDAVMGLTETSWAIIPGAGGTQRLPRIIGEAKAKELIFTAKKITAEEALSYGILMKVTEKEQLMFTCLAFANEMLQNGPIALQQAKYAINEGLNVGLQAGLEIEGNAYARTIPTKDRLEALQAFAQKRKPNFHGQ